jgi:predicted secreted hydrolase
MRGGVLAAALLLSTPSASRVPLSFPRDHGAHPEAAVEWWYYTGHLTDESGRAYGFQLTFFRAADLHLAHFAWSDVAGRAFRYEEKAHLGLPGIASSDAGRLRIANEDWTAEELDGVHRLRASGPEGDLELALSASKAPVLQGAEGLSRKGPGENEYSHYVSITRLAASGFLGRKRERRRALAGTAWFDHEWGPGALPAGARGWDWFAVQLSDGSELMLYRLRGADGGATPFSAGTFVPASGSPQPLRWSDVRLEETGRWTSPRTGARYPAGWRIAVPSLALSLDIAPLLPDQELVTEKSTGVTYWEGACRAAGSRAGRPVSGKAYAELTGYAGRDVPGFTSADAPRSPS